jgi:hypothetical protein
MYDIINFQLPSTLYIPAWYPLKATGMHERTSNPFLIFRVKNTKNKQDFMGGPCFIQL